MKVLGIRFCLVSREGDKLASFFKDGIGLPALATLDEPDTAARGVFTGSIFPAGASWIEIWAEQAGMPPGVMLQILVDDADAWAEQARQNGLDPKGPFEANGERIYSFTAPTGLTVTIQSMLGAA